MVKLLLFYLAEEVIIGLSLVETLLIILVPIATVIGFWVRLEMRVKNLEKQMNENPFLVAFKQVEREAAINMVSGYLKNTQLERKIG